jgi:hypothetical protein
VSDATAASDTAQKIGLFLSLDAAVASDTEKHCSCKQAINYQKAQFEETNQLSRERLQSCHSTNANRLVGTDLGHTKI